jgi:uncharacterized protein
MPVTSRMPAARAANLQTSRERLLLRRACYGAGVVGAACQGLVLASDHLPATVTDPLASHVMLEMLWRIGILGLAASYVCAIVLLFRRCAWRSRFDVFAAVGRMAFTNYLAQSVICTFLFYGWGLGWYGRVGTFACLGIALVLFGGQAAASRWWLRRFRFGPAEWAWRSLTYGRVQPFRAAAPRTLLEGSA